MAKRIDEILAGMNLTEPKDNNQEVVGEIQGKETDSFWLERNIEKYPIYFTGSSRRKEEIEQQIRETKKPYVIFEKKTAGGHQKLSISPSSAFGLITGEHAKVVAGIFSYLQEEIRPKLGYYPNAFRISMKEICERMYVEKTGPNYKFIIRALDAVSSFTIIQKNLFETKTAKGCTRKIEDEKKLHILNFPNIYKEDIKSHTWLKNKEYFVELEIEKWMIRNMENYFATKIDKEIYFRILTSQRSRKLFGRLCAENYKKEVELATPYIVDLLWIDDKENSMRKRSIERAIKPLVNAGFLENYIFAWDKIRFIFSKIRQAKKSQTIQPGEKIKIDSVTLKILESLGGIKSERLFRKIAQGVPEDVIYACLSQVKELQREGKITESNVGYFVTLIGRECDKRGIKTPFKRQKNTIQQLEIDGKR